MGKPLKLYIPILLLAVAAFISACKENGDLMISGKLSNLNIVNATANNLNVYQNGARLNNLSNIGPSSITGYTSITANSTNFEVKLAGASDYLIGNFPATLDTNHYYSLFIAGTTADKLFISNDATPADSLTMASVRFVNASPVSTNVDLTVDKLSFSNLAFGGVSKFQYTKIDTAVVLVYPHGSATPLTGIKLPLAGNSAFTIYLQGVPGGTGNNALLLKSYVN